jgi:hypothetical protein
LLRDANHSPDNVQLPAEIEHEWYALPDGTFGRNVAAAPHASHSTHSAPVR